MVHQYAPQLLGCNSEEMSPIFPVDRAGAAQPQVRLVDESRGLQGVFPALAPHLPGCDAMQLGVYKFYELVSSSLIASTPFREKASDCARTFSHIHRQPIRELISKKIFAPTAFRKV